MLTNILLWIAFGLIAGVIAQFLMPGRDPGESTSAKGFVITTGIGILGALAGGFLSSNLFGWDVTGFNLQSFGIAIGGALLLLILYRLVIGTTRTAVTR
jgi:uncharacterized membrane protein YeaQ/YmgE (transglycosylase-associated protein family)